MLLLVYSVTLFTAVLLSCLAERSVLSVAVIFLASGLLFGNTGVIAISPGQPVVALFIELALFAILFTDGMQVPLAGTAGWRLPFRALFVGLPLALAATAALGRVLLGVSWQIAFLMGAALSPTDPAFASAIIGREEVPGRVRALLNIESGLNDGLALPVVMALLPQTGRARSG